MKYLLTTLLLVPMLVFAQTDTIVTESTSDSNVTSKSETTLKSPPPSAILPSMNISNSDLCTIGVAT